jgi:hypothetical protein
VRSSLFATAEVMRPEDAILRIVVEPLPPAVERAWRAYDRVQGRIENLLRHAPNVEAAVQQFTKDLLEVALADGEPEWPSPVDVLAERQNLEAHETTLRQLYDARGWAAQRVGKAIVGCERQLCEALDDLLGNLQHEPGLRKAAHAVPLGVGGDGLLAAGPETAAQAALLGEALGRYEQIKGARRVIFDHVHPQSAPWLDVVAEGIEDGPAAGTGLIWKSEIVHAASGREPEPWAGGVGGELHYAVVHRVRLRVRTAAQLDEAGYQPAGHIYLQQPIRMG